VNGHEILSGSGGVGQAQRGRIFRMRKILAAKMPRRGLQRGTLWHGDVTKRRRRL